MARVSILDRLTARAAKFHAEGVTRRFRKALASARETQARLLREILAASAESTFGHRHDFSRIRTYEDFTARVPVHNYADLTPYLDHVRTGDVGSLFNPGTRILMYALTSGTTAQPKYIPITPRVLADCRGGWNIWGLKALLDHPHCILRHIVQVTSPMNDHLAPSGVPCGAITGLLAATQKRLVRKYYTSPLAVAGISDSEAKYYTIMRMAVPRDVAWLVTANPATLLALARTADAHREALIRDIRDGTLSRSVDIEAPIRDAIAPLLSPDPQCAQRLETIAGRAGALHPKDYWRLGFLAHWTGGTMGLYRSQFPKFFGDVPARDIGLIASEGRMSIPQDDGTPAGVLAVLSQFFEFIPAEEYGTAAQRALTLSQVQDGMEYFLVLTNFSGLFRYDVGDRVRVVGREGEAPVIEFLSRDAHTSSLAGEKLTEHQAVLAMETAREAADSAMDFVLAPRWSEVPRYRLYVDAGVDPNLAARLDAALCNVNVEYASKRKSNRLEAVELAELPPGTLAARDARLRFERTRTSEQFKHQYLLGRPDMDADLDRSAKLQQRAGSH